MLLNYLDGIYIYKLKQGGVRLEGNAHIKTKQKKLEENLRVRNSGTTKF